MKFSKKFFQKIIVSRVKFEKLSVDQILQQFLFQRQSGVFVIEQALSVRALQELVTATASESVSNHTINFKKFLKEFKDPSARAAEVVQLLMYIEKSFLTCHIAKIHTSRLT